MTLKSRAIPDAAYQTIREWENLRFKAYKCSGGKWTIGYGHTLTVTPSMRVTKQEALHLLQYDVEKHAKWVLKLVRVPLNDNQFAALISFVFNVGVGNFENSTLLKLLNQGKYEEVPAQLKRWKYAKGKILNGLINRRKDEAELWSNPIG